MEKDGIDLLAFTGHKSLYGPQGTGGLVIGIRVKEKEMIPLKQGGTGSRPSLKNSQISYQTVLKAEPLTVSALLGSSPASNSCWRKGLNKSISTRSV
jgi:selenocysteine lyase/cysteine desulfurase